MFTTRFRADDQGRFRSTPTRATTSSVQIFPPRASLTCRKRLELTWTKGAVKKEIDFKLPRGVLIRGKVTERGDRPAGGRGQHPVLPDEPAERRRRRPRVAS